ncbi:hypothetical protein V491_08541 [Pseudogymnoascus sp. VKM F-3775]|nr:hypothetical protein V491_08541 [Pseudogymnoascus sp. VKM F-3775]
MVTLLLDNKADIEAKDADNQTPLIFAVRGRRRIATLLLQRNADATAKDTMNRTPLIIAAANGDPLMVIALLEGHPESITEDTEVELRIKAKMAGGAIEHLIERALNNRAGLEQSSRSILRTMWDYLTKGARKQIGVEEGTEGLMSGALLQTDRVEMDKAE